ncbi:MAG TPA: glycosyltransferase [Spirochaetota bacterium]|nr:glycosyltransferase [Spirochaetota bacterium]
MNIVFYTSGISGTGRVVTGISIYNALKRKQIQCNYTMVTHSPAGFLAQDSGIEHVQLPLEDEHQLSRKHFHSSVLYHTLTVLKPDILIVYLQWFTILTFLDDLKCIKLFIAHQVNKNFFTIETEIGQYHFNPEQYNVITSIEPAPFPFTVININPLIMKNHDEILSKKQAQLILNIPDSKKCCLISISGYEQESMQYKQYYPQHLEDDYYCISSSNYDLDNHFPIVNYFNAFDMIICGAGYNSFWETRFFNKQAIIIPFKRVFEDQFYRVNNYANYTFTKNGADQLVDVLLTL